MTKKLILKVFSCILICLLPFISYAQNISEDKKTTFILKITSDKPQSFFGTYLTEKGLTVGLPNKHHLR